MIIAKRLHFQLPRIYQQRDSWDREHRSCRSPTFMANYLLASQQRESLPNTPFSFPSGLHTLLLHPRHGPQHIRHLVLLIFGDFMKKKKKKRSWNQTTYNHRGTEENFFGQEEKIPVLPFLQQKNFLFSSIEIERSRLSDTHSPNCLFREQKLNFISLKSS